MLLKILLPVQPSFGMLIAQRPSLARTIVLLRTWFRAEQAPPSMLVERDAAGVAAVDQVVADDRIGDAVHVDAAAAGLAVLVDDVVLDQRAGDDPIVTLREIAVHVDAVGIVVMTDVAADHRPVAAVAMVDPVLLHRTVGLVVLDHDVVAEVREDPQVPLSAKTPFLTVT